MIELLTWVVTVASLVGTVLNIKKRRECFAVWLVTNAAWTAYDGYIGAYAQAVLFAVYTVLAVWGLLEWRNEV